MNEITREKKIILCIGTYKQNIGVAEELNNIERTMRNSSQFDVEIKYIAKVSDFTQNATIYSAQIIHISGEGKENGSTLLIPDLDNQDKAEELRPEVLAAYLANIKNVNYVVLNFCYSKPVAELISKNNQCVIGVDGFIQSEAASQFSQSFYQYLENLDGQSLDHNSVNEAFEIGKAAALNRSRENKYEIFLPPQPEIELIEPTEGSTIPRKCKFSGTFSNWSEGLSMWAYVNATLERAFYLVPIEEYYSNGTWQKEVLVGSENDNNAYRVGVLIADAEVTKTLNEDFSKLGILRFANLPNGLKKVGDRLVRRQ